MVICIAESLDAVTVAYVTRSPQVRLDMIEAATARMASLRSVVRLLFEARNAGVPVLSRRHEENFIGMIEGIRRQLGGWHKKTAATIRNNPRTTV
ncbi:MAG: hypothetical protein K2H87_01925 [Duncaniella sp.]|nr:hypothetical protein [Duncaniella sp.]